MKKILTALIAIIVVFSISGCSEPPSQKSVVDALTAQGFVVEKVEVESLQEGKTFDKELNKLLTTKFKVYFKSDNFPKLLVSLPKNSNDGEKVFKTLSVYSALVDYLKSSPNYNVVFLVPKDMNWKAEKTKKLSQKDIEKLNAVLKSFD